MRGSAQAGLAGKKQLPGLEDGDVETAAGGGGKTRFSEDGSAWLLESDSLSDRSGSCPLLTAEKINNNTGFSLAAFEREPRPFQNTVH